MPTKTYKEFANALRQEVNNNYSRTPVHYPNQPDFNVPDDSGWVDMIIGQGNTEAIDIADRPTFREAGVLIFQIYTPPEEGETEARKIADDLAGLFRFKQIDTTLFRSPSLDPIGRVDISEGAWFQMDLTIPYRRDAKFSV